MPVHTGWGGFKRAIVIVAVVALIGAACGTAPVASPDAESPRSPGQSPAPDNGGGGEGEPREGGTLVFGVEQAIESLDPSRQSTTATLNITQQIYDTLTDYDLSFPDPDRTEIRPGIAESWDVSEDGRTYTFYLAQGAAFHDGTPLNAEAVKANFDRALDPSSPYWTERAEAALASHLASVESTRVVDEYTFEVTLHEPFASFIVLLADRRLGIISPAALEEYGDEGIQANPVGTGPFRFVERDLNTITLERNEEYWGTRPYLERLIYRSFEDAAARASALLAGDIDVAMVLAPDSVPQVEAAPDVTLALAELPGITFYMMNTAAGPTTSREFRQALNWAVDREAIVETIFGEGLARPASGPVPQGNPVWDESLWPYGYDPDRARDLIEQSGVETPITLQFMYSTSGQSGTYNAGIAQIMEQNFAELDISLEFERLEDSAYLDKFRQGLEDDMAAGTTTWNTNVWDPYWIEFMYASPFHPPNGNNRAWYSNEQVDELLAAGRVEQDESTRIDLYREAAAIIAEDAPWIWILQANVPRGYSDRVNGLVVGPSTYVDLIPVWVEE